jgi:hypothetical protein
MALYQQQAQLQESPIQRTELRSADMFHAFLISMVHRLPDRVSLLG